MQVATNSIYDLTVSEDKLHGAQVGHGNGEYIQVESGRNLNDTTGAAFVQGPIDFEFDLQTNQWWDPFSAFLRFQVSLTRSNLTQLQSIDDVAPAMNSASNLISQIYLYYNETIIDKFDADVIQYVDMINKRQDNTRNNLNFYNQQSNNNMSSSFITRQNSVINSSLFGSPSQSIVYQIPLSTLQYSQTQYIPGGRWMMRLIPNQNYKKDYVHSLVADKVPGLDYQVRVQDVQFYVKVVEGPRLTDSTFYINSHEYQKQTYEVFTNNIKNINNTTFYIPENTNRIAAFFRYKGIQDTRYPKTHFILPNDNQRFLSKFLIKYKGKAGPAPQNFNQEFENNAFDGNAKLYALNYARKNTGEFTPESLEDFSKLRGPYILADFDENSPIKSNEAKVFYQFSEDVTDLELVIICYVKKQFRVILENNNITRIDDVSNANIKYDVPKNSFNESLNRPGYYEDEIKGREIDFDQLTLLDIQKVQKVELSEKALQNLVNVQIPDPTDTNWQEQGRPQRTYPLSVNIANLAQSSLPLGVKISAIRTAVQSNNIETTDEIQGVSASIMSMLDNPIEYRGIRNNSSFQNTIDTTISNSLNIPSQPQLFDIYKQYITIPEFETQFSKYYLFLLSNIPLGRTSAKPLVQIRDGEKPKLISIEEFRQLDPRKWGLDIFNRNVVKIDNKNKSLFVLASEIANAPSIGGPSGFPPPPPPPPSAPFVPVNTNRGPQQSGRPAGFDEELRSKIFNPSLQPTRDAEGNLIDSKKTETDMKKNIKDIVSEIVKDIPSMSENKKIVKSFVDNILNSVINANSQEEAISDVESVISQIVEEIPGVSPSVANQITKEATDQIFKPISVRDILNASKSKAGPSSPAGPVPGVKGKEKVVTIKAKSIEEQKKDAQDQIKELIKLSNQTNDIQLKIEIGQEIDLLTYQIMNDIWDTEFTVSEYDLQYVKDIENKLKSDVDSIKKAKNFEQVYRILNNAAVTFYNKKDKKIYPTKKEKLDITFKKVINVAQNIFDTNLGKKIPKSEQNSFDKLDDLLIKIHNPKYFAAASA